MNASSSSTKKILGSENRRAVARVDVLSEYQRKLSSIFRANGYEGLRSELLETASSQQLQNPKTKSWPKLLALDSGGLGPEDWISFYLASMDRKFLQALIDGQIGRRMFEDDEFKYYVNKEHKLKLAPQIYLNTFSRSEFSAVNSSQAFYALNDATKRKWAGWGLTPEELEAGLDLMERYADLSRRDQKTLQEVGEVDGLMAMKPGEMQSTHARQVDRRYLPSALSVTFIQEWVVKVKQRILLVAKREMGPEQLEEPFPWCFQEVGFGQRAAARGQMHVSHDGTNHLFGLFTACLMKLYPGVFEIKTYAVMDVQKAEHADSCEILGSMLGGTYGQGQWMGLNPAWAGGNKMTGKTGLLSAELAPHFERNRKDAGNSLVFKKNWAADRLIRERFNRVHDADLDELRAEAKAKAKEAKEAEEELARLTSFANSAAKHRKLTNLLRRKRKASPVLRDELKMKKARTNESSADGFGSETDLDGMLDDALSVLQN